ncbi:replication initiator protein [Microviridae sp.]|nr:replication initiator protein [Microviridae sp.]
MPCYKPLTGWRSPTPNPSGKFGLVFKEPRDLPPHKREQLEIACGKCIGCRLEYSRQWALRCSHEAHMHDENCFITLTYADTTELFTEPNDDDLYGLKKRHWQLFLKKLRKQLHPEKIRFFMCGEYGEEFGRPHFHAIIFGWYPPHRDKYGELDLTPVRENKNGDVIYDSKMLSKIWGHGFVSVGNVTFESAAYVARYVTKKITGDAADEHYKHFNPLTGEVINLQPEFTLSSRRPGIAKTWFDKYNKDLEKGFITSRGIKMQAAKYYDNELEKINPTVYEELKENRKKMAIEQKAKGETTRERLDVKEFIKRKKLTLLPRDKA